MGSSPQIRAIYVDNEGCLSPGKGESFPLDSIGELRALIASLDVHFGICTGRSVPYVEALTQVLGLSKSMTPMICEGGAILYWAKHDKYELLHSHPLPQGEIVRALPVGSYRIEPGKIACLSLYPEGKWTVEELADQLRVFLEENDLDINLTTSAAAVDLTPAGVDKGSGVAAACKRIGVAQDSTLCIGDTSNDISMLRTAGISACPRNSTADVRALCNYVSPLESTMGVIDIIRRFTTGCK